MKNQNDVLTKSKNRPSVFVRLMRWLDIKSVPREMPKGCVCNYCLTPMVKRKNGNSYCPHRHWWTFNLHSRTSILPVTGRVAYGLSAHEWSKHPVLAHFLSRLDTLNDTIKYWLDY